MVLLFVAAIAPKVRPWSVVCALHRDDVLFCVRCLHTILSAALIAFEPEFTKNESSEG
jgi:hypothetical protein